MSTAEIVDPMSSPANKRWRIFQFLGPILGVLLVITTISAVSLHNYRTTRQGAIQLSNDLLKSQQRYITQEVSNYLSPASNSIFVAREMLNRPDIQDNVTTFMLFGRSILRHAAQVDSFYLADDQGHFWMMARRDGHYEETALRMENNRPVYRHTVTDEQGKFLFTDALAAEGFDPRQRPWYEGALKYEKREGRDQIFWTDPYPYLSTHQFIITASGAMTLADGHKAVFAISISLNQLTQFVNSLKVGKSGQAVIVDLRGRVIAGHNMAKLGTPGFDASNVYLDPVSQPVFTRVLNIFRVHGPGAGIVHARGQNYVSFASSMPLAKRFWVLLLNAPEKDFADFALVAQQQTVIFSLIVIGLALLLAVGLIIQGRRVDRLRQRIAKEHDEIRKESASMLEVANVPGLLDPMREIPILTEMLAERAGAKRVSLWRLLPDGDRLLCEDAFDATTDAHGTGMEIGRGAHDALFEALHEGRVLDVSDAAQDPRFQAFQRVVMRGVEATRLLFYPVMEAHRAVGAILVEDPTQCDTIDRAIALAISVVGLRFSQSQAYGQEGGKQPEADALTPQSSPLQSGERVAHFSEGFLLDPAATDGQVPSGFYPRVPVMVLVFSEVHAVQEDGARRSLELLSGLAGQIEDIVQNAGLFSMQIAGNRFIFLGSCSLEPDPGGVLRLADAAISVREACLQAIAGMDVRLTFRIGLDVGAVMASQLGGEADMFNVWGEGVSVAELLAGSAPDVGLIQVSEQAYQELRGYFLFRPRGVFYLPGNGVTRNYILAGRR